MCSRCVLTVDSLTCRRSATWLLLPPPATSCRTSSSRGVNGAALSSARRRAKKWPSSLPMPPSERISRPFSSTLSRDASDITASTSSPNVAGSASAPCRSASSRSRRSGPCGVTTTLAGRAVCHEARRDLHVMDVGIWKHIAESHRPDASGSPQLLASAQDALAVVRVRPGSEVVERRRDRARLDAEQAEQVLGPLELARAVLEVPRSDAREL